MLNPPALAPAVAACHAHAIPFRDLMYRTVHLRWFDTFPNAQPLYAAPGGRSRFVQPGGHASVYAAFDPDTAYREGNQEFYRLLSAPNGPGLAAAGGLRPDTMVLMGVHVTAGRILDLMNVAVRQLLNIRADAELLVPWKNVPNPTPTQLLGEAVFADNFFEGIIYPSAQNPSHRCLVLLPGRFLPASRAHFQGFHFPHPHAVSLANAHVP
jgi:RES domain-containing protein